MSDAARDERRREVAASGLTPTAVAHLTRDALGTIDFAKLAPVKTLLKRFFSDAAWTAGDAAELADLVGTGEGWWRYELDNRFTFEFGWRGRAFRLELSPALAATFDGPVTPEATPNPRSIRFVTPPIHDGPSRWYESRASADDPRAARLFDQFAEVANVLVGPDFVAVGLTRPDAWEHLLDPILAVVTAEFTTSRAEDTPPMPAAPSATPSRPGSDSHTSGLDRAWRELGALRPEVAPDLERILAAASSPDTAERQVAARMLIEADGEVAAAEWARLLGDSSRSVRRATVDAMVDAQRPALRPRFERALADTDAWTRWKALRGLAEIGVEPSRDAVTRLADDPDFRVRLETARALRAPVVDSRDEEAR